MPDRLRSRNKLPTWLPLAAGGTALAVLLALIGGYFVYQDQQDRAARVAHAECVLLWKQVNNCSALMSIEQNKKYDELRVAGVGVAEASDQADAHAKASAAAIDKKVFMKEASRLGYLWGVRWARLGLPIPGP